MHGEDAIIKGNEKRKKEEEVSSNLMKWNNSEDALSVNFDFSLGDFDEPIDRNSVSLSCLNRTTCLSFKIYLF